MFESKLKQNDVVSKIWKYFVPMPSASMFEPTFVKVCNTWLLSFSIGNVGIWFRFRRLSELLAKNALPGFSGFQLEMCVCDFCFDVWAYHWLKLALPSFSGDKLVMYIIVYMWFRLRCLSVPLAKIYIACLFWFLICNPWIWFRLRCLSALWAKMNAVWFLQLPMGNVCYMIRDSTSQHAFGLNIRW